MCPAGISRLHYNITTGTPLGAESRSSFLASLACCQAILEAGSSSSGKEGAVLPGVDAEGVGLASSLALEGN
jgi:hypothetical protein